jgi:hypothetical protein
MPAWAVRHRPVVIEAGVMRVNNITYGGCIEMGLDMSQIEYKPGWDITPFARYWNKRWPKYPYEPVSCLEPPVERPNPWAWWALVEVKEQQ